jgi:hypothetical protein
LRKFSTEIKIPVPKARYCVTVTKIFTQHFLQILILKLKNNKKKSESYYRDRAVEKV